MKDKDMWRELFAALPDEQLPPGLNDRIMQSVCRKVARRRQWHKRRILFGYASGVAVMVAVFCISLHISGVSLTWPVVRLPDWASVRSFYIPDFTIFKSPFFAGGTGVGLLGLLLLVVDEILRRHAGNRHAGKLRK